MEESTEEDLRLVALERATQDLGAIKHLLAYVEDTLNQNCGSLMIEHNLFDEFEGVLMGISNIIESVGEHGERLK